ncbi:hypothetical protein HHK36_019471 [Tetracentron sinense]|uniref:NAC domain-containing protein n=1 Tax=Tetracentron sinense TaxID=13715 RepID=A0A835D967_TETSI|nr:hypothetical protein HHK36_019471 [Tetracentron sinense]
MSKLPPGYRFDPSDEELVGYFLTNKLFGTLPSPSPDIKEIVDYNVYQEEPWFLPHISGDVSSVLLGYPNRGGDITEMYFFVMRELKTKNSKKKPNRVLTKHHDGGGWWKASGGDKKIHDSNGFLLGKKKSLVFYSYGRDNGTKKTTKDGIKTNWIMHEYSLAEETFQQWVLCRIRLNEKVAEDGRGSSALEQSRPSAEHEEDSLSDEEMQWAKHLEEELME